jgi:NAD+ synthase (glutamine-hydrolysing)
LNGGEFVLSICQLAAEPGAPAANAGAIAAAAGRAAADGAALVLTSELSLTGYDVGDDAAFLARPLAPGDPAPAPLRDVPAELVVGLIERGADGVPYNVAAHYRDGALLFRHRKIYLPTYGMFDEGRFFGRGRRVRAYDAGGGWRVGLLVCEDFWHPALPYLLALQGCHLLMVQAAAPGRGVGEAAGGGRFASAEVWERIARTTAQLYGIYVALANRAGAEGAVAFAGGSLIVGPDGGVLARGTDEGEDTISARLSLAELRRARRPYAHARDEDPLLLLRELGRALEADE